MNTAQNIELISPAGDSTSLHAALDAGADAVYFGAEGFNMRAASKNFTIDDFPSITRHCTRHGAKAYLALNTLVYDKEIRTVAETVRAAKNAGIDAVICWDISVIQACRNTGMPFHISTQASVSNYEAAAFYAALGAGMIVPARELSIDQVKGITEKVRDNRLELKIECFVHGAMCVAVSGRCFLSQDLFGRSANRGQCLQPCRRTYLIRDPEENNELEIGCDTVMNPKDLCSISFLDKLVDAGITGMKIEGRNRSPEYVATTTACYREAIDYVLEHRHESDFTPKFETVSKRLEKELKKVYNRGFSNGFYFGRPVSAWAETSGSKATEKKVYTGNVQKYYPKAGVVEILVHTRGIQKNEKLSIQGPTTGLVILVADSVRVDNRPSGFAEKGDLVTIACKQKVRKNDKVYVLEPV